MRKRTTSVVALIARRRELGYAVFDGRELVRFGVKTIRGRKRGTLFRRTAERCLTEILSHARSRPTLILEPTSQADRRSGALRRALDDWAESGPAGVIKRRSLSLSKQYLCADVRATHRQLLDATCRRYPILRCVGHRLPMFGLSEGSIAAFAVALGDVAWRHGSPQDTRSMVD